MKRCRDTLKSVESAVRSLQDAYLERYEEEILTVSRVNLRMRIRFLSGHMLELNEALVLDAGKISHLGYRYHFQNRDNVLLFRYDNTPHFPDLKAFPHHKHLPDRVVDTDKPAIVDVIGKARLLTGQTTEPEGRDS